MAYIQQQTQSPEGADQTGVMPGAYDVQIGEVKHVGLPIETGRSQSIDPSGQPQHQQATQRNHGDSNGANDEGNNHQSSSTSGSERHDNHDRSMSMNSVSSLEGGVKTPNSYKYPLLKRYYEFGPWIGRNRKAVCLGCHLQTSSSQPDRLLKHLNKCTALTDADKVVVTDLMNERTANKRKKQMHLKLKRDHDVDSEYYGEDEPNTGIADDLTLSSINACHSISIPAAGLKKLKRDHTDRNGQIDEALTRFIMMCRIPLKAIHSQEFIDFARALNPDYRLPSRETITNVLIPGLLNII